MAGNDLTGAAVDIKVLKELDFDARTDAVLEAGVHVGAREEVGVAMHFVQIVEVLVL